MIINQFKDSQWIEFLQECEKSNDYPTVEVSGYKSLINNMRVNLERTPKQRADLLRAKYNDDSHQIAKTETIVISGSKPKVQTIRQPVNGQLAIIDWINLTFDVGTIAEKYRRQAEDDDVYMQMCQKAVQDFMVQITAIFGKSFSECNQRQTGANFYKYSFDIGENYGKICIGGQRDTVLIMINGTGCTLAKDGWERRLYDFLKQRSTIKPKITRVDLAHDDLRGEYLDVHELDHLETDGLFHCGGARHTVGHLGDWKYDDPRNKGLTLNLGMRESGKFARFYQKGKKLGDKEGEFSKWVRAEIEFKANDRVISFDVLLDPSAYFMGAYPVFADLFEYEKINKLEIIQKTSAITLQKSFDWLYTQAGKYISFYRTFMSDEEILDLIQSDDPEDVPKRLHLPHAFCMQQALMGCDHNNFKIKELQEC